MHGCGAWLNYMTQICLQMFSSFVSAGSRKGLFSRLQFDCTSVRRKAEPWYLAGGLAVRTQGPSRFKESSGNGQRSPKRPWADPFIAKLAHRIDEQLMQGPLAPFSRPRRCHALGSQPGWT